MKSEKSEGKDGEIEFDGELDNKDSVGADVVNLGVVGDVREGEKVDLQRGSGVVKSDGEEVAVRDRVGGEMAP